MIKFKVVRWKNLLSTGNQFTEVQLDRSLSTLIIGNNGGGKSTIIDAITFALYGKPFRNINKGQLVNSINRKDLVVELEFTIGTKSFKIVRGIKPNKFEIYVDEVMLDQTAASKDYQAYLEENILKLNYKSFTQNSILASAQYIPFMQLPAASRREVIEDLLDISVFSKMNEVLKARVSTFKNELAEVERDREFTLMKLETQEKYIVTLDKDKKDKIQKLEFDIICSKSNIVTKEESVVALEKELNDIKNPETEAIKEKITKKLQTKEKLSEAKAGLTDKHIECTEELLKPFTSEELEKINSELVNKETEIKELVSLNTKQKAEKEKCVNVLTSLIESEECDQLRKDNSLHQQNISDDRDIIKQLEHANKGLEEEIRFLEINTTCPTCTQDIKDSFRTDKVNEKRKTIEENKAEIILLTEKNVVLNKQIESNKHDIEKIEEVIKTNRRAAVAQIDQKIKDVETEISVIMQEMEALVKEKEAIKDEYFFKTRSMLDQINLGLKDIENRFSALFQEIAILEKEMDDAVSIIEKQKTEIQSRISKTQASIESEKAYVVRLESEISNLQSENSNIEEEIDKKKAIENLLFDLETQYNEKHIEKKYIDVAVNIMKDNGIKTSIIKKYIPIINKLINSYLQIMDLFVEYELDETFNEKIKSRHRDEFSYASFSEGEKARIDLAILFTFRAVAKMKSTSCTNLLLLDETFDGSIDSDGSDSISAILRTLQDTNVFCISHNEKMFDKFRSIIKFSKVNNYSVIIS